MKDEAPVRRHVSISARSSAQLELRLHWFTRALAVRGGYILATLRRSGEAGRHVATVAYEMPLPKFARPGRGAEAPQHAGGALEVAGNWPQRQAQGTSSGLV
ncbi:MAG: hypothetical protein ABI895_18055 [Deltaproteobacteria bacterium]